MRWRKREMWKVGFALAGTLLLLLLMVWVPLSAAGAQERASGFAIPVTTMVQKTPTEDATVTALNKEKLVQEVQQLKNQNAPDPFGWLQTNASILLSTLVVVVGALFGLWRWRVDRRDAQDKELEDRRDEREKRAEERFQTVVTGLGDEREEARISAAILLRTFLRPGNEEFYVQTFDLAVAHLRLPRTSKPPEDLAAPLPLTTLSQALIVVFKEAFPLARSQIQGSLQALDATGILLDNAYLTRADLKQVRMRQASMRNVNFYRATLSEARLFKSNLSGADLNEADLSGADLGEANIEEALSLIGTNLHGVKGLTKEQLEACKAKGAIIDEDSTAIPSQPTVSPPLASQSTDGQTPSATSAQGSRPIPDGGGSNAASSKPSPES